MISLQKTGSLQIRPLLLGIFQALIATALLTLILAATFFFTKLPSGYLMPAVHAAYGASALWAGWTAARKAGSKGLIYGVMAGLLFFAMASLIGLLFSNPLVPMTVWWKKLLYAVIGGAAGGAAGISFKTS